MNPDISAPRAQEPPSPSVEFNRDVRPIFEQACLNCHGPSDQARSGDLRLDVPGLIDTNVLRPGDSEASSLFRRLIDLDDTLRMPPAPSERGLTATEIGTVRDWIDMGAPVSWETRQRFSLTGRIVDATDRTGIEAVVYALQLSERGTKGTYALADDSGLFELTDIADTPMELRFKADGYTVARVELDPRTVRWGLDSLRPSEFTSAFSDDIGVVEASFPDTNAGTNPLLSQAPPRPTELPFRIQVQLQRSAIMTGRVHDTSGDGVANATVTVSISPPEYRWLLTEPSPHSVTTLPSGDFEVEVPASRQFSLHIAAENCESWTSDGMTVTAARESTVGDVALSCADLPRQ